MIAPNGLKVEIDQEIYLSLEVERSLFFDSQTKEYIVRYGEAAIRAFAVRGGKLMAGLTLNHIYKRYDNSGKKKKTQNDFAVKDLNLACEQGEFVPLCASSGCGKTMMLRMIAGLEEITEGEIYIGDRLVNNLHPN